MGSTSLGDEQMKVLGTSTTIKSLNLRLARFSNEGYARDFSELTKSFSALIQGSIPLESLDLWGCEMVSESLVALSKSQKNLRHLELVCTTVVESLNSKGLTQFEDKAYSSLTTLTKLRSLYLTSQPIEGPGLFQIFTVWLFRLS